MKTAGINEALVLAFNPPPIFGLGTTGGFGVLQNKGSTDPEKLKQGMQLLTMKRKKAQC